ncbi:Mutyh protein, partial [Dimargaris cristalligena]
DLAQRAYEVWVSEIMLQQTQVVTVRGYYQRWMAEFPTITRLAAASLDRVYEIWTGLGYYSRARRLHEGAQKVVTHYDGGRLPADPAVLLEEVPGVGKYTAGAIASIAYGRPAPLVDGNVTRVLTRWFAFAGDVTRAPGVKWTWAAAEYVLQTTEPGHWNQALMELGATVCAPVSPKCNQCPIQSLCRAYKQLNDP